MIGTTVIPPLCLGAPLYLYSYTSRLPPLRNLWELISSRLALFELNITMATAEGLPRAHGESLPF